MAEVLGRMSGKEKGLFKTTSLSGKGRPPAWGSDLTYSVRVLSKAHLGDCRTCRTEGGM